MEHVKSSLLFEMQSIPGETRELKFKEIGRIVNLITNVIHEGSDFTTAVHVQNIPDTLVPLIKVLVGRKIKSSAFIIEALKSDDSELIIEALRAKWFFDGSDTSITNYKFYSTEILPFVSMCTRRQIVKKLAVGLSHKQVALAEEFFNGFATSYGVQEAIRLLPACGSEFIYEAVTKRKIALSNKILKIIYFRHPDVALRYLKFANPFDKEGDLFRIMFKIIDLNDYKNFMPLLVTKHPEIYIEMQDTWRVTNRLGIRRSKMLLNNAKEMLIQKPKGIIDLMSLKQISDTLTQEEFETLFGNLLEERWDMFRLESVMNYLEYYPKEKRAALIRTKVKEKYGRDIFENVISLTTQFLLLLPKEERYSLARKIIEYRHKADLTETSWWCYLPLNEAISALKVQIARSWRANTRRELFTRLVYVCKLNESKEALLDVLKYIDGEHKNGSFTIICNLLDYLTQEFDLDEFNQDYWTILFRIIKRIKLKTENARDYWVLIKILKKNVHYCDKHNLPTDEIINLIVQLFLEGRVGASWKLLEDEAKYERKYLDVCFKHDYWLRMGYKRNVVEGIYGFNERHITSDKTVQKFSIKDYPQLLKVVEGTLKKKQYNKVSWVIYTKEKLKRHEPELYSSWFPDEDDTQSDVNDDLMVEIGFGSQKVKEKIIYVTEAIIALKRNYSEIKTDWIRYYEHCQNEIGSKKRWRIRKFLKALRWYQDVPIQFAEQAIKDENFDIIGYLFDGVTYAKLVTSYLPRVVDKEHDKSYLSSQFITAAAKHTSSPVPVELVQHYLQAHYMYSYTHYINDILKLWAEVSYRTRSDKLIGLLINVSSDKLFIRKHTIRLISTMASSDEIVNFLSKLWSVEKHLVVREDLAEKIGRLFVNSPNNSTWNLVSTCIEDLSLSDDIILCEIMGFQGIPIEFACQYAEKVLKKLFDFVEAGIRRHDAARILDKLFGNLQRECTDYLSDHFYNGVFAYYMKNTDLEFMNAYGFIVRVYLNPSSVHFENRVLHVAQLMKKESERWFSLSMENRNDSPNFIDDTVQVVVHQVQNFEGNLKLVESLFNVFSATFLPYQYAWSHVMLFLCVEYMRVAPSFKNFGIKLSENIDTLINKFTPEYFMQIIEYISQFICSFTSYDYSVTIKSRLKFMEGLIENKNVYGCIIAAKLLDQKIVNEYNNQHCKVLQQLSEIKNPVVQSFV